MLKNSQEATIRLASLFYPFHVTGLFLYPLKTNTSACIYFNIFHYFKSNGIYRSSRPEVFCKKSVLRKFAKFTGERLCQSLFFNKVAGRPATLLKKRLWHSCFIVNFAKFLRTPFLPEHLWWLLLNIQGQCHKMVTISPIRGEYFEQPEWFLTLEN